MPEAFLADENVPLSTIRRLRESGLDVAAIREIAPSVPDARVLDVVRETQRILLSFDLDIGALVYQHGVPPPRGVILFRCSVLDDLPALAMLALLSNLDVRIDGQFPVLDGQTVRQRALP